MTTKPTGREIADGTRFARCWVCPATKPRPVAVLVTPDAPQATWGDSTNAPVEPLLSGRHWEARPGIWRPLVGYIDGRPVAVGVACGLACCQAAKLLLGYAGEVLTAEEHGKAA